MKPCPKCKYSGRPGLVVFATYYDRMVPTDVVGQYRLTSGKEYAPCFWCSGDGEVSDEDSSYPIPAKED